MKTIVKNFLQLSCDGERILSGVTFIDGSPDVPFSVPMSNWSVSCYE